MMGWFTSAAMYGLVLVQWPLALSPGPSPQREVPGDEAKWPCGWYMSQEQAMNELTYNLGGGSQVISQVLSPPLAIAQGHRHTVHGIILLIGGMWLMSSVQQCVGADAILAIDYRDYVYT